MTDQARKPQSDNNEPTYRAVVAAADFLAARPNQAFMIASNKEGYVHTLDPDKHPRPARQLLEVMNEAAKGEIQPNTVIKMVLQDALEAGRDWGRTVNINPAVDGEPERRTHIYNISDVKRGPSL